MDDTLALKIDALTYTVCIDGGVLSADDEDLTDVRALDRAKRYKAEHPEYLVTIVVDTP